MSRADIDAILNRSRENNSRRGITGVLLYLDGSFMQVLEGRPEQIEQVYTKILVDPRHTRITRIILEAIPRRFFGDWSMGLSIISSEELAEIIAGGDVREREALLADLDEGRAKKLLRAFSEGRWRQTIASAQKVAA